MARVEYGDEFARDIKNDVQYLQRIHEPGWIATLEQDLTELEALLGQFPQAGVERARSGSQVMLKMRMQRAPFYVWYVYDPAAGVDGVVTFIRLFHTRQQTPELRFPVALRRARASPSSSGGPGTSAAGSPRARRQSPRTR